jgi:hypothetical protein
MRRQLNVDAPTRNRINHCLKRRAGPMGRENTCHGDSQYQPKSLTLDVNHERPQCYRSAAYYTLMIRFVMRPWY